MIMDIMAIFGIFHNFLRCVSLYSCMTFPPLAQSPFPSWLENNNASKRCQQSHCCASFMPAAFIWSSLSSAATRDARKKWALILHQFEPSLKKYFPHQNIRSLVLLFLSFLVSYCFSLFDKKLPQMSAMIHKCFFPQDNPFKGCFTMSNVLESLVNCWGGQK